jgi:serine/threonine protein kinase
MMKAAERLNNTSNANTPCPFCAEIPGPSSRTFITHVARHMEEIALAVLPRDDSDSDFEHGSTSSSHSLPAIFGDAAEQNIANPAAIKPPSSSILQARVGLDDFNLISTIGKGNSAKVILAESKHSKKLYAIKVLKKELLIENGETRFSKIERRILKLATEEDHPFVVHLCGTFQSETRLYFITEYVPGGDLMWHIQKGPFPQERAQ